MTYLLPKKNFVFIKKKYAFLAILFIIIEFIQKNKKLKPLKLSQS